MKHIVAFLVIKTVINHSIASKSHLVWIFSKKRLNQQSAPRLDFGCPDLLLCALCTPRKASLDAVIPAPASRAPASLRLFLQCASKQYHLPSDFCLSITGPSVSVRCRWHEAHVGNSQLLHRLCGTTGLTFLDQLWALQGIIFWPAGAHCCFPGDQKSPKSFNRFKIISKLLPGTSKIKVFVWNGCICGDNQKFALHFSKTQRQQTI